MRPCRAAPAEEATHPRDVRRQEVETDRVLDKTPSTDPLYAVRAPPLAPRAAHDELQPAVASLSR